MTSVLATGSTVASDEEVVDLGGGAPRAAGAAAPAPADPGPGRPRSTGSLVAIWLGVAVVAVAVVLYGLEPLFQQREQRRLLEQYDREITQAVNESQGLPGIEVPTNAPERGAPVGIIEIGDLGVFQVVVEGVQPAQTQAGPGHVPGTAGLGQPGNSVVVGRRGTYGAPFADLGQVREGAEVAVVTTQGESLYRVTSVEERVLREKVLAPTEDDRLTLVTSASAVPWNGTRATVVVAELVSSPFAPTPQGGRTVSETGSEGDPAALSAVILAALGFALSAAGAVWFLRRSSARVAYLVAAAPLIASTVIFAEAFSRLLPGWM